MNLYHLGYSLWRNEDSFQIVDCRYFLYFYILCVCGGGGGGWGGGGKGGRGLFEVWRHHLNLDKKILI